MARLAGSRNATRERLAPGIRALLVLVGAIIFIDTAFYAALAPILADLEREFDLGKTGSGVLAGMFPAGTVAGAIPAGWLTARLGPRRVLIGGLTVMATAGTAFALGSSAATLDVARFVQGLGGACTWTASLAWVVRAAPPERRSELIGLTIGIGIFGAQFGPVVGTIADAVGREATFLTAAIVALPLAIWARIARMPAPREISAGAPVWVLRRDPAYRVALLLTFVPSLAFGVIEVLAPLRLDALGATALEIGRAHV